MAPSRGTSPSTSSNPVTLQVGDFDGDGKLDLVAADNGTNRVSILLGNGDGTFRTLSTTYATGSVPIALTVGDFNGDGMTDIIVGNVGSTFETLLLAQQTSTATATASRISPMGTGTHQVQANYSGDGIYAASQSNVVALTAQPLSTFLGLRASSSTIPYGQQLTLTATLSPFNGQGYTTDGETITFLNGSTTLGTGTLASGVATFATTSLPLGTANLTAAYSGDTNFSSASSGVSVRIVPAPPTITFAIANHTYGDAPFTISATSNSTATLSYAVVSGPATISGSTVTITGVGTVVLVASQSAQGDYTAGSQQTSFNVASEQQTISFAQLTSPGSFRQRVSDRAFQQSATFRTRGHLLCHFGTCNHLGQ